MKVVFRALLLSISIASSVSVLWAQSPGARIVIRDESSARIAGASVLVETAQGLPVERLVSDKDGMVSLDSLPRGSYLLTVDAANFQTLKTSLQIAAARSEPIEITLRAGQLRSVITITAQRGRVEDATESALLVNAADESALRARPLATLGNALEASPGVLVQQSTYGQVSPFLRGLTGYQVLNLVDGIRFNNSTFRSGPNQYLAFLEPSQAQRIESVLGPTGVQYGSDALGGTINVLSEPLLFSETGKTSYAGEWQAFGASADASGGSSAKFSLGTGRLALMLGGAWKRHNDLRAGHGVDSRHVFNRFFGLSGDRIRDLVGDRQQDTGFAQYGGQVRLAAKLREDQTLSLWYQRSVMDGVRGYKDLWGGLGRLRSDFDPQELHFFYGRYEKLRLGFLDSLTGTFSINAQRDGSRRQNLRSTDVITTDDNNVNAFGYAAQGTTHLGARQMLVFGGELYHEAIRASRVETNPATGAIVERRALYPNGSRYSTAGLFAQHSADWFGNRLRTNVGTRFTHIGFRSYADRNRSAAGGNLGVTDEEEGFDDVTYNASVSFRVTEQLRIHATAARGFRAPNLNDLGALGLNDLGYEVPASEAAKAGALLGNGDGETALPTGSRVAGLNAEKLFNYELGISWQNRKVYARAQVFDAELKDPIVRRTLLFPAGAIPQTVAGLAVQPIAQTADQRAQNVVTVATSIDPRALKAFVNTGQAKYYGVESILRYSISPQWMAEGNYSFLAGRELNPNRFIRRLPPQQGFLAIRHQPSWSRGKISWLELAGDFVGAQERLSGGDLTDERIGAGRRRRDITDFFRGARNGPYVRAGADGRLGTDDDVFAPTGETLAQVRDRVLPIGGTVNGVRIVDDNSRAPLYLKNPGYAAVHFRSAFRLTERIQANFAVMNLLDKNYRVHGSGVDAPGRNFYLSLRYSF